MRAWNGQRVVIIGAARQGLALGRYLARQGARVTLTDQRPAEQIPEAVAALSDLTIQWALGGHPLGLLDDCDLLCPSGGVSLDLPLVKEACRRGLPLSNDSQIFLEVAPCKVIGITGSAGKTTTTTLVGRMAQAAMPNVFVGGNIGSPLVDVVDEMQPDGLAVMELSSFQLEIITRSPQVAAILNITPNHLDRHGTMEAYTAAKAHILTYQSAEDVAVLGHDDPGAWALAGQTRGRLLSFGIGPLPEQVSGTFCRDEVLYLWDRQTEIPLMPKSLIGLRGEHNLQNVLAACAIAAAAGLPVEAMRAAVEGFTGVPHRLEFVSRWGGADWYNDSIATAPERAMAAIHSFDEPLVLLAGGRDKKLPWGDFADLVHRRVDHLILFGEAAELIRRAVGESGTGERPYTTTLCHCLKDAVQAAKELVEPGDVVLLSPGGTSFDEFRDFEARGEAYRTWVRELT
jgi:UDP-N-acetylmuramoylalanine--D-glutamate ligase